jgi:putative ABC transport system permease protein
MLRTYLKTSIRNLLKFKAYTAINIGGLGIALAAFLMLLLYLNYELSYDRWSPDMGRAYRVTLKTGTNFNDDPTPAPLAPFLAQRVPGITAASRIQAAGSWEVLVGTTEKQVFLKDFVSADSGFFSVFPYRLVQGDPATVFSTQGNVALSQETATLLFGRENPIGKTVLLYNKVPAKVTGVFAAPSTPTHFGASVIMRDKWVEQSSDNWQNFSYTTYLQTRPGMTEAELSDRINRVYYDARIKKDNLSYDAYRRAGHEPVLVTERVTDIHNFPKAGGGHFSTTLSLFILAILLLVSGAINFSNLSLVKSFQRAKEVGVRKVLGSSPLQIRLQFLIEVGLQCLGALVLSLLLVRLALPAFDSAFGLDIHLGTGGVIWKLAWQLALALVLISVVSGLYPSLVLSRFRPVKVLKGESGGAMNRSFSSTLTVVQFAVSVFFICCVVVVALQMHFMKTRDLGLNTAQVVRVGTEQRIWDKGFEATRRQLLDIPGVEYVSKTTVVPGTEGLDTATNSFLHEGKEYRFVSERVSEDLFATLSVPAVQGRLFSYDHPEDEDNTAIINETAAKALGAAGVVGSSIQFKDCATPYQIVGVVRDFHVQGFETKVQPALYSISNSHCGYQSGGSILLRIRASRTPQVLASLTQAWKTIDPGVPLRYTFMDEDFANLLKSYTRLESIILLFAGISILIALVGLLALAAYVSQRRTKEIGIRKVLGAGLLDLTGLLTRQFTFLVAIGILVAVPLAWYALHRWLDGFAYHISLSVWVLMGAGGAAFLLSVLTVGLQALRAARANPMKSLRMD